tara:strand:- start:721 stop:1080 length:360 start_codon:yes stop_codon:yes gene_type:complete
MVLVNESFRPTIKDPGFTMTTNYNGYKSINTAMNPQLKNHDVCSWRCHNSGCKPQLLKSVESYIDPIYDGIISFLKSGDSFGSYGIANILFLVLLWPLVMFYFLIKSLDMQQEIKNLKV